MYGISGRTLLGARGDAPPPNFTFKLADLCFFTTAHPQRSLSRKEDEFSAEQDLVSFAAVSGPRIKAKPLIHISQFRFSM